MTCVSGILKNSIKMEFILIRSHNNSREIMTAELEHNFDGVLRERNCGFFEILQEYTKNPPSENHNHNGNENNITLRNLACFRRRCRVLFEGSDYADLLRNIDAHGSIQVLRPSNQRESSPVNNKRGFSLEYDQTPRLSTLEQLPFAPGVTAACWLTQELMQRVETVDVDNLDLMGTKAQHGRALSVGTKLVLVDYKEFVILAEELVGSSKVWDEFFTNWCKSRKPFTFNSGLCPYVAAAGIHLLTKYYWDKINGVRNRESIVGVDVNGPKYRIYEKSVTLIDGCCGSGTVTAVALRRARLLSDLSNAKRDRSERYPEMEEINKNRVKISAIQTFDVRSEFLKRATMNLEFMDLVNSNDPNSIITGPIRPIDDADQTHSKDKSCFEKAMMVRFQGDELVGSKDLVDHRAKVMVNGRSTNLEYNSSMRAKIPCDSSDDVLAVQRGHDDIIILHNSTIGVDDITLKKEHDCVFLQLNERDWKENAPLDIVSTETVVRKLQNSDSDIHHDIIVLANTPWGHRFGGEGDGFEVIQGIVRSLKDNPALRKRTKMLAAFLPHNAEEKIHDLLDVKLKLKVGKPAIFIVGMWKE